MDLQKNWNFSCAKKIMGTFACSNIAHVSAYICAKWFLKFWNLLLQHSLWLECFGCVIFLNSPKEKTHMKQPYFCVWTFPESKTLNTDSKTWDRANEDSDGTNPSFFCTIFCSLTPDHSLWTHIATWLQCLSPELPKMQPAKSAKRGVENLAEKNRLKLRQCLADGHLLHPTEVLLVANVLALRVLVRETCFLLSNLGTSLSKW